MWSAEPEATGASQQRLAIETTGRDSAARLLRRVDERWRALARANERGLSVVALERLYDAYVQAVDAYIANCGTTSARA